jgi:hypothetical protein
MRQLFGARVPEIARLNEASVRPTEIISRLGSGRGYPIDAYNCLAKIAEGCWLPLNVRVFAIVIALSQIPSVAPVGACARTCASVGEAGRGASIARPATHAPRRTLLRWSPVLFEGHRR